jgi:hypothetical protein
MPVDRADPDLTDAGVYGMLISLIATTVKRLGAVCLAFVVLWHVGRYAGPQAGEAIVHVARHGVIVSVDNRSYRIDSIGDSPVVCELAPGTHTVKVYRDELLLSDEDFTVEAGKQVVLFPIARTRGVPAVASIGPGSVPASESVRPAGLAVRIPKSAAINH